MRASTRDEIQAVAGRHSNAGAMVDDEGATMARARERALVEVRVARALEAVG